MSAREDTEIMIHRDIGFKFFVRRITTHKQMNEQTKRIENEYTNEASLSGNADTYEEALSRLKQATSDCEEQVALNGVT